MRQQRQHWLDWPLARLLAHAEANRGDIALLRAVQEEARRRRADNSDEIILRIQGLLAAHGVVEDDDDEANVPDLLDRIDRLTRDLQLLEEKLLAAEKRARLAEIRANAAEERARLPDERSVSRPQAAPGFHERVHLAPSAPTWLIEATQRAYRLRFHPDRFVDPASKTRAEAVFKEAEMVFARLREAYEIASQK